MSHLGPIEVPLLLLVRPEVDPLHRSPQSCVPALPGLRWQLRPRKVPQEQHYARPLRAIRLRTMWHCRVEQQQRARRARHPRCALPELGIYARACERVPAVGFCWRQAWVAFGPLPREVAEKARHTLETAVLVIIVKQVQHALHRPAHALVLRIVLCRETTAAVVVEPAQVLVHSRSRGHAREVAPQRDVKMQARPREWSVPRPL
mmetsp:Transcript_11321/g.26640  ORF Transcript_11321/g.26640 Transcript_11321/m.26640 type:complete len:205 (+) Transcript_11321:230-844(+)